MVFPMYVGNCHFTALGIYPRRKTAGYYDGLFDASEESDNMWLPQLKAAIRAAGDDDSEWSIELELGKTRANDHLQRDDVKCSAKDCAGVDYKSTQSRIGGAFQCGVHVHVFCEGTLHVSLAKESCRRPSS